MSWSICIDKPTLVAEAREKVQAMSLPLEIQTHIGKALTGIEDYFVDEPDLKVIINGYGHLCSGEGSYPVTSVSLSVQRAP